MSLQSIEFFVQFKLVLPVDAVVFDGGHEVDIVGPPCKDVVEILDVFIGDLIL